MKSIMHPESNEPIGLNKEDNNKSYHSPHPWYALGSQLSPAKVNKELKKKIINKFLIFGFIAVILFVASTNYSGKSFSLLYGGTQNPPTLAALAGGCTGIADWTALPSNEIGWIPQGRGAFLWRVLPPVSGNFNKIAWKTMGYIDPSVIPQPNISGTLADIYRGWVIVWMAPTAQDKAILDLKPWITTLGQTNRPVLVVKWPLAQPSTWTTGRNVVFVSWNHWEACTLFDTGAVSEFITSANKVNPPGLGLSLTETGPKAVIQTSNLAQQIILPATKKITLSPKK